MTIAQQARAQGVKAQMAIRGRDATTDTDEKVKVLVEDVPQLADPDRPPQQEQPVYTRLTALAGAVEDPRAVGLFTEADGRWHKVLRYEETSGDKVTWRWFCEGQRQ